MAGIFLLLLLIGAATGGSDEDQDAPRSVVGDNATTLTLPLASTTAPSTTTTLAPTTTTVVATTSTVRATTTVVTTPTTQVTPTTAAEVYYANCAAARAAGAAPIRQGQPGYRTALDGDRDGIACDTP
jgi:hypothetical protein